jgi:hypothetical protein
VKFSPFVRQSKKSVPVISPAIKKAGVAHQHTAPATMILVVSVRKGGKNQKRIISRSSPNTYYKPGC